MFPVQTKEDVRQAIGYMLIGRYRGAVPDGAAREVIKAGYCHNIIEFADNVGDLEQVYENHLDIMDWAGGRCLFSIDQEGGRVQRIKSPFTVYPPMGRLAAKDDPELMTLVGKAIGLELRSVGYHIDYAPVVDVNSNPDNPIIGDRAFGDNPEQVCRLTAAFIKGLQGAGVAACAKHFPGHGDSSKDSHKELPLIDLDMDTIRRIHWPSFKNAIDNDVALIMSAHLLVPALDGANPATLSPVIIGKLRQELGYNGPVATDALDMGALSDIPLGERVVRAVLADIDLMTMCHDIDDVPEAFEALVHAVEKGQVTLGRLQRSMDRLAGLWQRYFHPVPDQMAAMDMLTDVQMMDLPERLS